MKATIKHNLLLLKKIHFSLILLIIVIIGLYIKRGTGLFIMIIPTIVCMSVFTMEDIGGKKYKIIFSLPTSRAEFAKAKFITLLIIYSAATLFVLAIYIISVIIGRTNPIDMLPFVLELAITFPLSIFLGGNVIEFVNPSFIMLYPIFMNLIIYNMVDVKLQVGQDIILDVLIVIIWLGLSVAAYVGSKNSIINVYESMEL
ncbi:MAG: hypothetical protein GX339_09680 [Tissierellia bacterium]|nr:hypothetical protein [Tissierellia bacterium]